MELIIHPTIKTKHPINYNHIIELEKINIYIGNAESREAEKFDYIIEICNENDVYAELSYSTKDRLTLQFDDSRRYNILDTKDKVTEFINSCSGKLLIHCGEGISRSPSILIMYLISRHNYSYMNAYTIIQSKRYIKPNIGFVKQLQRLESQYEHVNHK